METMLQRSTMLCRAVFAILILVTAGLAHAQTTGTISGVVTDKAGAMMPHVQVTARNVESDVKRVVTTNASGEYSFASLAPGDYELTFLMPGFGTIVETATLNVTEHIAVNSTMKVSNVNETIEVSSQEPLLQTENTTEGALISGEEVSELPLATNNFTQLLALSPGVLGPLNDATGLGRGTQVVNVNGARTNSNSVYVDGVDAVNVHTNSASNNNFASNSVIIPPPDATAQIKISTALFDATTGRSGGSNTALITKTGTDEWHGNAYEFFRNTIFNANSYFLKNAGQAKPQLNQNQFGASIGGPLIHKKLFVFFNYQGTRQINGYAGTTSTTIPKIPQDRSIASLGAFGASLGNTSYTGPAILANGSNINPVAVALLQMKFSNGKYVIPSPVANPVSGPNLVISTPSRFNEDEYTSSAIYQLGKTDTIAVHAIVSQQPQFHSTFSSRFLPGFGLDQHFKSRLYSISETHIFSPNVVNEFHFGLNRTLGKTGFEHQIQLADVGMTRFNSGDFSDIPEFMFSNSMEFGYTVSTDQADTENTWQYFDNVSWLKGKHNLNFGVEMRRYQDNFYSNDGMRGTLDFISFQNFMLGQHAGSAASGGNGTNHSDIYQQTVASGLVQRYDRLRDVGLFAQDSWKAAARVTINYGLRWEYLGLPTDTQGHAGSFYPRDYVAPAGLSPSSMGFVQAGNVDHPVAGIARGTNTLTDTVGRLNFAPRLGVAVQLNNRMVMRGGYGLFYDRLSNQLGLLESLSLPYYESANDLNTEGATSYFNTHATLQNPFPVLPTRGQFPVLPQIYNQATAGNQVPIGMFAIDPKIRTPYYQQFGLNVQTQLMAGVMLQVGYVGANGKHLPVQTEINQALLASATNPVNGATTNNTGTNDTALIRAPYQGFSNTGLLALQTVQSSNFNSLQATLTERLGKATLLATYMWSRSLDTGSGTSDGTVFTTSSGDQMNQAQAYGPSDFDRTHHVALRFTQPLPTSHWRIARGTLGSRVFGGYVFSGVAVLQSGLPFSIENSGGAAYYGTDTSRASFAPGKTVHDALKSGRVEDRISGYLNNVFVSAGNFYGNTGRNIFRASFQRNLDISLIKSTRIHGNVSTEFRAQAFNVTNTPNFGTPNGDISGASFGTITTTAGNPRILQFAIKIKY